MGKTTLAALLCAALDAVYWKPIQTGTLEGSDRVTVMRLAGIGTDRTLEEVYKFVPPVSPDLAARWAGVEIDLNRINPPTSLLNDWLIVEGAGGVLVPINGKQFMLDMMVKFKLPVISGGAQWRGHDQSHAVDAGGIARGGVARAWRGADWRPEPGEPRDHREIRTCPGNRRNSQASEFAPHRFDASLPEPLRPIRFCTMKSSLQIWHPFTNGALDPAPLLVTRAEGVYLHFGGRTKNY